MGSIDFQRLATYLNTIQHKVLLGWFRFRRNTPVRPSIRDLAVHRNFVSFYKEYYTNNMENTDIANFTPLFGLFTSKTEETIHSYSYKIYETRNDCNLNAIDINIVNLVNSSKEEYEAFDARSPLNIRSVGTGSIFGNMYEGMQDKMKSSLSSKPPEDVLILENFYEATTLTLQKLGDEVEQQNRHILELQR
eukprot:TRINITY_DN3598_c0_g2_i1.p1 TRINITY_DN3598_c0_g2~~TRINITY_DN3598_c0_g2_i1.p1  ORF type:complete len:192 (-),score=34.07 TRINITY_DN3598_c0_g2_i1:47-622(-)